MQSLVAVGPWGTASGANHDITVMPVRLETITIRSGDVLDAISFSYRDWKDVLHTAGPFGGTGGGVTEVRNDSYVTYFYILYSFC